MSFEEKPIHGMKSVADFEAEDAEDRKDCCRKAGRTCKEEDCLWCINNEKHKAPDELNAH